MSTLVVMAAGLASRYGGVKQLEAVGPSGERLFDYAVYDALRAGCDDVVFVIRPQLREIFERDVLPQWPQARLAEQTATRAKPWGTAHALVCAAAHTSGDLIVCNADDWYGRTAYRAVFEELNASSANVVAGYQLKDTLSEHGAVTRAILRTDNEGYLQGLEETQAVTKENAPQGALTSMNLWGFHRQLLDEFEQRVADFIARHQDDEKAELPIPNLINAMIRDGRTRVRVRPVDEQWFGMTYTEDLPRVKRSILQCVEAGAYPANLFSATGG